MKTFILSGSIQFSKYSHVVAMLLQFLLLKQWESCQSASSGWPCWQVKGLSQVTPFTLLFLPASLSEYEDLPHSYQPLFDVMHTLSTLSVLESLLACEPVDPYSIPAPSFPKWSELLEGQSAQTFQAAGKAETAALKIICHLIRRL